MSRPDVSAEDPQKSAGLARVARWWMVWTRPSPFELVSGPHSLPAQPMTSACIMDLPHRHLRMTAAFSQGTKILFETFLFPNVRLSSPTVPQQYLTMGQLRNRVLGILADSL
jgi:hypothetical protein